MTTLEDKFGGTAVVETPLGLPVRSTLTERFAAPPEKEHEFIPLDLSTPEPLPGISTDPRLIRERARSELDISKKTGLSLSLVHQNHNLLKAEIDEINKTWTEAQKLTISEWNPGVWERMLNYLYTPEPAGGFDRSDRPFRTAAKLGAIAVTEFTSGLALGIPDIVAEKITGEETAGEAVAKALDLERVPREKAQGQVLEGLGRLKTVSKVVGPVIGKIQAHYALKMMLDAGVTFGAAETIDQAVEYVTSDKPINIEGIHFNAGVGVLFGAGAAGVKKFTSFLKGFFATKTLSEVPGVATGQPGVSAAEHSRLSRIAARKEINAAMKARKTNPKEWERVMDKYVRAGKGVKASPETVTKPRSVVKTPFPQETKNMMARYNENIKRARDMGDFEMVEAFKVMERVELTNIEKRAQADASQKPQLPAKPSEAATPPTAAEPDVTAVAAEEGAVKTPEGTVQSENVGVGADKQLFHGSKQSVKEFKDADLQFSERNIYGQGFYITDDASVAKGYAGKGDTAKVHAISITPEVESKLYDMEQPIPTDIQQVLEPILEASDFIFEDILEKSANLREVYDDIRNAATEMGVTASDAQIVFDTIRSELEKKGFVGFKHQGGLITGGKPHTVRILWNPKQDATIGEPSAQPAPAAEEGGGEVPAGLSESKVVDRRGKPITVFHGTDTAFEEFSNEHAGSGGFFFTDDPIVAKEFTSKGIVKEVFLNLKNPLDLTQFSSISDEVFDEIRQELDAAGLSDKDIKRLVRTNEESLPWEFIREPEIRAAFIKNGYDGVIFNDHGTPGDPSAQFKSYVAFSADQIVAQPAPAAEAAKRAIETAEQKTARLAKEVKAKKQPAGVLNVEPIQKLHDTFVDIVEPARTAEKKVGKEAVAAVMKGVHNPDVAEIEFTEAELVGHDKTIGEMRKFFSEFPDKDLRNLMLSRGTPITPEAQAIQKQAIADLPEEFEGMKAANAIQQIADFNYAKLQEVVGEDINKVKDYFYGIYEDPDAVDSFVDTWKTTDRFIKEKKLPTVADAVAYGLELRHANPVDNLKAEYMGIARLEGMTWMRDELIRTGKGIFIEELADAPLEMKGVVRDPVFRGLRLHPDLAKLINNLIEKNWVTTDPGRIAGTLNVIRQINNFSRTVKFAGSGFHLALIAQQSFADAGYMGFLYKKTALRGLTLGFKQSDPIFKTEAYKDYVANGGGHRYSIESQSERALNNAIADFNATASTAVKLGMMPLKIPTGFVKWMFESYIPKVKYGKYLDRVNEQTKKLGRNLKSSEKQDIIKENQNFYGMMNERLFGRSGTVTTMTRFPFMSPGFAEGDYRTMLKAIMQWGRPQEAEVLKGLPGAKEKGFDASRSRANIFNSLLMSGIVATTATIILTGKPPKKPENLDDMRDLLKIDTGKVDDKGRKIMIDTLTYGRDYWDIMFNLFRLRPDKAAENAFKRVGGMTAPTAKMMLDMAMMASGRAIYDYKGDRVVEITDTFLQKTMKLAAHEIKELSPIALSVFTQARNRELDTVTAAIGTLMGLRVTKTEEEFRNQKITSNIYSLRGQKEKLHLHLGRVSNPRKAIKTYNKTVQSVLNYKHLTPELKAEWEPKLIIDVDRLLENKAVSLGTLKLDDKDRDRAIAFLKNFDITEKQFEQLLEAHADRPKKKSDLTIVERRLEGHQILGPKRRQDRAIERFKEGSK